MGWLDYQGSFIQEIAVETLPKDNQITEAFSEFKVSLQLNRNGFKPGIGCLTWRVGSRGSCTGGYCENEKSHDPSSPSPSSSGSADIDVSISYINIHTYDKLILIKQPLWKVREITEITWHCIYSNYCNYIRFYTAIIVTMLGTIQQVTLLH